MEAQVLTITFFGHRDTKETPELKDKLNDTISFFFNLALEQNSKLKFLCGHYGNFDALSSLSIDKIRKEFPSVECEKIFVTPYFGDRLDTWVASHCDSTIYPPLEKVPYKYAIVKRNEWMADNAQYIILHSIYSWGGTARMETYAKRKNKKIIYI